MLDLLAFREALTKNLLLTFIGLFEIRSLPPTSMPPILKQQEIPFDSSESCHFFQPGPNLPLVATPAAIEMYTQETIVACLRVLHDVALRQKGLDYLQVFQDIGKPEALWFIEDSAITALLPSDY